MFAGSVLLFASNIYFIVGVLKSYTGVGVVVENGDKRGGTLIRGIKRAKRAYFEGKKINLFALSWAPSSRGDLDWEVGWR